MFDSASNVKVFIFFRVGRVLVDLALHEESLREVGRSTRLVRSFQRESGADYTRSGTGFSFPIEIPRFRREGYYPRFVPLVFGQSLSLSLSASLVAFHGGVETSSVQLLRWTKTAE